MCEEQDVYAVLRLLCLLSLTQGGVPKKYFDALRKEILHSYGHEYLLMLSKLQDAGGQLPITSFMQAPSCKPTVIISSSDPCSAM